jgi:hypothetical protein
MVRERILYENGTFFLGGSRVEDIREEGKKRGKGKRNDLEKEGNRGRRRKGRERILVFQIFLIPQPHRIPKNESRQIANGFGWPYVEVCVKENDCLGLFKVPLRNIAASTKVCKGSWSGRREGDVGEGRSWRVSGLSPRYVLSSQRTRAERVGEGGPEL